MEGLDLVPPAGLESQVDVRQRPVGTIDPQLIDAEILRALAYGGIFPQSGKDGSIEALARLEITHAQVDVIDESA